MASQSSYNTIPILAIPIFTVPSSPSPTKMASGSNPNPNATPSKSMPSKPLPNPYVFFQSEEQFSHANTPSSLSEKDIRTIRERYQIPETHHLRRPSSMERMYQCPEGWIAMPLTLLEKGVRFPLHVFLVTLLGFVGVGFAQLVLNSYIHILAFIAFCHEVGVAPTLDFFFSIYTISKSREKGFKVLSRIASIPGENFERRSLINTPSSNKGWHNEWLFVAQ